MSPAPPPSVLDLESLAAEVSSLLDDAPVAEATAAKLSRLLQAFLEGDVLPQAERAASLGLDPTPLLAVVSEVLRLHADALKPPATGSTADPAGRRPRLTSASLSSPRAPGRAAMTPIG